MNDSISYFLPVDDKLDWEAMEAKMLSFWEKNDIFIKLVDKLSTSNKRFSFIDGPITANNPMGVHHARGRTLKDIFQRYKAMQGFNQRFQNGFDTQGLWLEVETEKSLGLNSKKDILEMGIETFVNHCKARVLKYTKLITRQSKQLGQQMDWNNSYFTHLDQNIEYIWFFLSKCHKRGLIHQKRLVMPWCPRCSTSLSAHEMIDSYRLVKHPSVYLQLPLKNYSKRYFLVWTTTPWTLTANTALAVHPNLTYLLVKQGEKEFYIAKTALKVLKSKYKVISSLEGSELVDLSYQAPFNELDIQREVHHKVVPWKGVSAEEGTGIVHIAPGCGAEDFDLGKNFNLKIVAPVDEHGKFIEGFEPYTDLTTNEAAVPIIQSLENKELLYEVEVIKHRYPVCWRCKTELIFKLETEWFISCDEIRPLLIEANKTVTWIPDHAGKRMNNWLENMGDWCISRKRFWGLPLPFYLCDCGELTVIGGIDELRKLTDTPKLVDELSELHRPWIDAVLIKCPKCNQLVKRIQEVGDCWLDAGIVPFSTLNYLTDKNYWNKWFPADLVCEMIEQVRLWFYSQLFMAVILENKAPFRTVVIYDEVRHEDGSVMSKSGDMITFDEAVNKSSADVLRWTFARQKPETFLRFGFNVTADVKRKFIPFWNAVRFFANFGALDISKPSQLSKTSINIFDQWILTRLNMLIGDYNRNLEHWDVRNVTFLLEEFFNDLTNWYIRSSRRRFWKEQDSEDKNAAYSTLYHILINITYLLAPFMPFLAEYIYQILRQPFTKKLPESVHLCPLPSFDSSNYSQVLLENFDNYKTLVEQCRLLRNKSKVKLRQPLSLAIISGNLPFSTGLIDKLHDALIQEFNVKELRILQESPETFLKKGTFVSATLPKENISLYLVTKLSPELLQEGLARDLVRAIQQLRKEADLKWNSRIKVKYDTNEFEVSEAMRNFEDYIRNETLSLDIQADKFKNGKELLINNNLVKLAIVVISSELES